METVLIVVHLLIVSALAVVVLLQRSEGGGLGIGGGGGGGGPSGFLTGRGQASVLTRSTAFLGAAFFVTSIILAVVASRGSSPRSIIDGVAPAGQSIPGAPAGSVLDQLNQIQRNTPTAPPTSN